MLNRCEQCAGNYELESDAFDVETVECPHCGFETRVFNKVKPKAVQMPVLPAQIQLPTHIHRMEGMGDTSLFVYQDRLEIHAAAFFGGGSKKTISFRVITAVTLKLAGAGYGLFQFTIPGGSEMQNSAFISLDGDLIVGGSSGSNVFQFTNGFFGTGVNDIKASEIRDFIEKRIEEISQLRDRPAIQPLSIADELVKLAALKDKGLITESEFKEAKANIIK